MTGPKALSPPSANPDASPVADKGQPAAGPGTARIWALIPCAGAGTRAGTAQPKQYHPVAGRALVMHTLAAFGAVQRLAGTLVVVSPVLGMSVREMRVLGVESAYSVEGGAPTADDEVAITRADENLWRFACFDSFLAHVAPLSP